MSLIRHAGAFVTVCAVVAALAQPATADQPPQSAQATEAETGIRPERAFTIYFGRMNVRNFTSILTEPWKLSDEDTTVKVGASVSHLVWELDDDTWIDGEIGVSKRFGESDEWEAFGLVFLRWDGVPWSDWLYTSFGVGVGPSFVTEVSETERKRSGNEGSRTLNMLVPEVAFALPDYTDAQLVFRLHHRSGVFGLFSGVSAGSTFMTAGFRIGF